MGTRVARSFRREERGRGLEKGRTERGRRWRSDGGMDGGKKEGRGAEKGWRGKGKLRTDGRGAKVEGG